MYHFAQFILISSVICVIYYALHFVQSIVRTLFIVLSIM